MIAPKKINPKSILLLVMLLFLWSCHEKKESKAVYKKPSDEKTDSTCTWLKEESHFFEPDYEMVFNQYYQEKIKAKDYPAAAKALETVAWKAMRFQSYKESFLQTLNDFAKTHKKDIPEVRLRFVPLYLGKYYADKSDFKKAIAYYTKAGSSTVFDYETCYYKAISYRNLAWCYFCIGDQNLALENNLKALDYFRQTDRTDLLGGVYTNFYTIYSATKEYGKAEKSLDKALFYFKKNREKQESNIFICLYNKINLYDRLNYYEKRNALIDSTLISFKESKIADPSLKISLYLCEFKKKLDESKLQEAEKILTGIQPDVIALNSEYSTNDYNVALAIYEIKKNKGIKNTRLILDAIPKFLENEDYQNAQNSYSILHDDAVEKKDYEKALDYYAGFSRMKDSMGSKEMANKVAELNTRYQTEKKEQQIQLQEKTILNKNTTIALLISGLTVLLLLVAAISLRRKQKRLHLEKQNAQLYTKQLLEKTEEERKRIASDLHDSVSHELLSLKNTIEEKTELTNNKIDAIINDIRIISRNLHPVMFDKIGLKTSIEQLVERAQSVNSFMVTADIDYHSSLSVSDELQVYRIIQEALSNIIKYADAVAAKITLTEKGNTILIEIKDNGKGFNVTETLSNSKAFGLHNIIERTRAIGGEAKIISGKNGTIITIEIKKS